jgi:hypothetical protein
VKTNSTAPNAIAMYGYYKGAEQLRILKAFVESKETPDTITISTSITRAIAGRSSRLDTGKLIQKYMAGHKVNLIELLKDKKGKICINLEIIDKKKRSETFFSVETTKEKIIEMQHRLVKELESLFSEQKKASYDSIIDSEFENAKLLD